MQKYRIEFILHTYNTTGQAIKSSLAEFGEDVEVQDCLDAEARLGRDFKINIVVSEPEEIFDLCAQFGRIKSVKIDDGGV
ncbi:MAG: hypothetical protein NC923_07865 [Candidatus Omnitrophica bacterium]|nr:hypothetical protein [Candidatus Omnitrophota bacterium]